MPIRLCLFFHYWALIASDGTWRFLQNYINFRKRLSRKELLTPKNSKFSIEFSKSFTKMTKTKQCARHIFNSGEKHFLPCFVIFSKSFLIRT